VSTRSPKRKRFRVWWRLLFGKKRQVCQLLVIFRPKIKINDANNTRVIHKVRKTQHQNPEFDHTHGEIPKKAAKKVHEHSARDETQKTINFRRGKLSFILSFLFY
jgi:hypothetical protein